MIEEEIEEIMDEDEKSYKGIVLPYEQLEEVLLNFFKDASMCESIDKYAMYFFDVQCEVYLANAVCVITKIGLFTNGCGSYLSDEDFPAFERTHFRNNSGATFADVPFRYDLKRMMPYIQEDIVDNYCIANYLYREILLKTDLLERDNLFRCVPGNDRYVQRKRVIDVQTL